jgi:hypothetical protein
MKLKVYKYVGWGAGLLFTIEKNVMYDTHSDYMYLGTFRFPDDFVTTIGLDENGVGGYVFVE